MAEARSKLMGQPKFSDLAGGVSRANWQFVETLLKECKTKVSGYNKEANAAKILPKTMKKLCNSFLFLWKILCLNIAYDAMVEI